MTLMYIKTQINIYIALAARNVRITLNTNSGTLSSFLRMLELRKQKEFSRFLLEFNKLDI